MEKPKETEKFDAINEKVSDRHRLTRNLVVK
jgi:hypothetical protein